MLRSAVDCQRCVFTEPRRCDARLFAWLSYLPPLPKAIALARQASHRGRPQEWNSRVCHLTRRRAIARAKKEKLRREKPRHYLSLDSEPRWASARSTGPARATSPAWRRASRVCITACCSSACAGAASMSRCAISRGAGSSCVLTASAQQTCARRSVLQFLLLKVERSRELLVCTTCLTLDTC